MHKLNMTLRALGAAAIGLVLMATAAAQQPGRIRGAIEKADGSMLVVKTREVLPFGNSVVLHVWTMRRPGSSSTNSPVM